MHRFDAHSSVMKPTAIYALLDPRTAEPRYIGKSVQPKERFWLHLHYSRHPELQKSQMSYKDRWIASLLHAGAEPRMVIIEWTGSKWQDRERFWIALFLCLGFKLTNTTKGGDGIDAPRTKEWREKIGAAHRGKKRSQETIEKVSATNRAKNDRGCKRGHAWSEENTQWITGKTGRSYRQCKTCYNANQRRWRKETGKLKGRRKTQCKRGHVLSKNELIRARNGKNQRECYLCKLEREKTYKRNKRSGMRARRNSCQQRLFPD